MFRDRTHFWALAIVVLLLAAQVHVLVDAGPARASGHYCQFCVSGVWAVVSAADGLDVTWHTVRLEAEPAQADAKNPRTETSAPRAPPLA